MPRMGLAAPIKNIVYLERSRPIACNGEAAKISKSGQPPSATLPDPGTLFNEGRHAFPSIFGSSQNLKKATFRDEGGCKVGLKSQLDHRWEERREGKECVSLVRSRGRP